MHADDVLVARLQAVFAAALAVNSLDVADELRALASSLGIESPAAKTAVVRAQRGVAAARSEGEAPLTQIIDAAAPVGLEQKRKGAWYTPPPLASGLVRSAIARHDGLPSAVLDATCGGGVFLLAVAEHIHGSGASPDGVVERLWGADIDPVALVAAGATLASWSLRNGGDWTVPTLVVHDVVHSDIGSRWRERFDLVVGNPPFLSQLRARTARTQSERESLAAAGYRDASSIVLDRSLGWLREGGVVCLVLPRSFLGTRDSAPVRERVVESAALTDVWFDDRAMFDASVRVWSPVLVKGGRTADVQLLSGVDVASTGSIDFVTWSGLAADAAGVPRMELNNASAAEGGPSTAGTVDDIADVSADFRDWFYELAESVSELASLFVDEEHVRVVTSGAIDPLHDRWGSVGIKLAGTTYSRPVVERGWLEARPDAARRLAPKVIVANQSSVVEAIADTDGTIVGSTPTISIVPESPEMVMHLAALCTSPVASVWCMRQMAGSGLSPSSMRLTARLIAALPLPPDRVAWSEAAAAVASGARPLDVGSLMMNAYGLAPDHPVYRWWADRLPVR